MTVSYGDYVEQLTFLLFLKMAHERTQPPYNQPSAVPEDYSWPTLVELDGIPLEHHYRHTLETLGKDPAVLAAEIVEDLQAALDQFALIATDLAKGQKPIEQE